MNIHKQVPEEGPFRTYLEALVAHLFSHKARFVMVRQVDINALLKKAKLEKEEREPQSRPEPLLLSAEVKLSDAAKLCNKRLTSLPLRIEVVTRKVDQRSTSRDKQHVTLWPDRRILREGMVDVVCLMDAGEANTSRVVLSLYDGYRAAILRDEAYLVRAQ